MKLKNVMLYGAESARIFLTVLIVLIAVSFLQALTIEIFRMIDYTKRPARVEAKKELTQEEKRSQIIRESSKKFLLDGTLHLFYQQRRSPGQLDEPNVQIYDVNNNLLWEGPSSRRPYHYPSWASELRRQNNVFTLHLMKQTQMLTPAFSRNIEIPVGSINNTEQIWRYLPDAEYFVGYNSGDEKIGYIGATGFSDLKSKAKSLGPFRLFTAWCPMDSSNATLLWQTDERIYQIDFEKQYVELILESHDSDIEMISLLGWRDLKQGAAGPVDPKKYRPLLLCTTEDGKYHLILRNPDQRLTFTIPKEWQGWISSNYRFTATKQGIFLLRNWIEWPASPDYFQDRELYDQWRRDYESQAKKLWVELYKINDGGNLELVNRYDWTVPAPDERARFESMPVYRRFVTDFSPPLYTIMTHVLSRKFWLQAYRSANRGDFFYAMMQVPLELHPLDNIVNWLISLLMMGFVFWHGWSRRTSNARFASWLVFVGLLNLTGLLTYLALNHTAVIRCPACGRRRGLGQADCVRCQAPLPAPERRPLDLIFDA